MRGFRAPRASDMDAPYRVSAAAECGHTRILGPMQKHGLPSATAREGNPPAAVPRFLLSPKEIRAMADRFPMPLLHYVQDYLRLGDSTECSSRRLLSQALFPGLPSRPFGCALMRV